MIIICAILLIYLRDPRYFTQPRFWAEEGMLHFAYSFSHPWWQALFQPQVGYLNFYPNLATVLATFVPLESAPLVTTLAALLVQLLPIAIILQSPLPLWKGWGRKILGCAIVLFVPLTNEGWLNTINSFTYFPVVAFLILLEDAPQTKLRWVYRLLLVLAGLSGVLACSLVPLFLLCAWYDKQRERWIQALLLSTCAIIQIAMILSFHGAGDLDQRFSWIGFSPLGVTLWTQSFLLFTTGYQNAKEWGKYFRDIFFAQPTLFMMWGKGLFVAAVALIGVTTTNLTTRLRVLFLSSISIFILLFTVFSIIPDKYLFFRAGAHQRAFLAPNMILGWMFLAGIRFPDGKGISSWVRRLASILCAVCLTLALLWGVHRYFTYQVPTAAWHDWRAEVQTWRADPNYHLRIQPDPWVVELKVK